ncbi:DUF6223 family protein [Actinokineospora sp. NPDC004072]
MLVTSLAQSADAYTLSPGRLAALAAALLGLAALTAAILSLTRFTRRPATARRSSAAAVALGAMGAVIGALVVVTADGGLGTGNGLGGGVVSIALGLAGAIAGGVARRRTA